MYNEQSIKVKCVIWTQDRLKNINYPAVTLFNVKFSDAEVRTVLTDLFRAMETQINNKNKKITSSKIQVVTKVFIYCTIKIYSKTLNSPSFVVEENI